MAASVPPLQENATRILAEWSANFAFEDIPASVVRHAKLCILDGVGVCLQGSSLPWTRHVRNMVRAEGGNPVASLWGGGGRTSWSQAVLVNSTAGHAFEMDDIHRDSVLHPNSITVPVSLGCAEVHGGMAGRDVLTAIIAGYEIGARVGNAATTALFLNGFHPQGTTGTFAAGATAAKILGLDAQASANTLGIAGSLGAGLMAAQEGAMVKRLHSGRAAQSGVYAALLARDGFTGISDVVEAGYGGFLSSLARTPNISRLTAGLGTVWETANTGFKMYPCVTSIHAALDALRALMAQGALTQDDIATVEVGVGHMTYVHTAWDYKPAGVTAAQMNMFFGLACIACGEGASAADYVEANLAEPRRLDFMRRVKVFEDPEIEAMGPPARHACRMTVTTRDGRPLRTEIIDRRGSPENPVSWDDIEAKFRGNAASCLTEAKAEQVVALVRDLDTLETTAALTELLAGRS